MNKAEFVKRVAAKTESTIKDSEKFVNCFLSEIAESLKEGETVEFTGFGKFEVKETAARKGFNPQTKEPIEIAASKKPVFTAGKAFKESVK